jgi:hypothetical protein
MKMQSQLTSLTNPRWADEANTMIDCEITTSQFGDEVLPFTASANDVESHGREIFADIVAGNYGEIGAYVPPPPLPENTATPSSGEIPGSVL